MKTLNSAFGGKLTDATTHNSLYIDLIVIVFHRFHFQVNIDPGTFTFRSNLDHAGYWGSSRQIWQLLNQKSGKTMTRSKVYICSVE